MFARNTHRLLRVPGAGLQQCVSNAGNTAILSFRMIGCPWGTHHLGALELVRLLA